MLYKPRLSASSNVVISKIAFWDVFPNSFVIISLFFKVLNELETRLVIGIINYQKSDIKSLERKVIDIDDKKFLFEKLTRF